MHAPAPVHGYAIEDWFRAFTVIRTYWRKYRGVRNTGGEGTARKQKTPAVPMEYWNPANPTDVDDADIPDDQMLITQC